MASRPFCEAAMDREIREYLEDRLFPRVRGDGGWMEICRETEDKPSDSAIRAMDNAARGLRSITAVETKRLAPDEILPGSAAFAG